MEKEWFSTNELVGVGGLPRTPQGLNRRAREDGWEKRRRKGVQGKGVEYSIYSLPEDAKRSLLMREEVAREYAPEGKTRLLAAWIQIFHQLSEVEQTRFINLILRDGTVAMLARLEPLPQGEEAVRAPESVG